MGGWRRSFRRERRGVVSCVTKHYYSKNPERTGVPELKGRTCPLSSLVGEMCREFKYKAMMTYRCNKYSAEGAERKGESNLVGMRC